MSRAQVLVEVRGLKDGQRLGKVGGGGLGGILGAESANGESSRSSLRVPERLGEVVRLAGDEYLVVLEDHIVVG